ncbi:hypothetical protein ACG2LH_06815 [Zhouia sp. PK063]|uniref:IS1096 element passenger TnpR family protein n=1 Tax=Zhouia sp. PK063 TaxID=3373602 RepID=UPI00378AF8BD
MIYKFRVILDAEDDVFRDLAVEANMNLEDFHNVIAQSFGFDGTEMASFFVSDDEWNQGEEISQFDMGDGSARVMNETTVDSILDEDNTKLIYVYDFLSMWTFFVEVAEIAEPEAGAIYPVVLYSHGQLPDSPPEKKFEGEDLESEFGDEDYGFDVDDYDNLDFDENWN